MYHEHSAKDRRKIKIHMAKKKAAKRKSNIMNKFKVK